MRFRRERRCPRDTRSRPSRAHAQPTRLAIFRLLVKHEPVGITAGVIAETVGAPHNTLSSHLAILVRAGLLRSSRDGRTIIYRSDVEGIRSVIAFLINDCCDGHPELCNLVAADAAACCAAAPAKTRSAKKAVKPSCLISQIHSRRSGTLVWGLGMQGSRRTRHSRTAPAGGAGAALRR